MQKVRNSLQDYPKCHEHEPCAGCYEGLCFRLDDTDFDNACPFRSQSPELFELHVLKLNKEGVTNERIKLIEGCSIDTVKKVLKLFGCINGKTQSKLNIVTQLIEKGYSYRAAANSAGVSIETIKRWSKRGMI